MILLGISITQHMNDITCQPSQQHKRNQDTRLADTCFTSTLLLLLFLAHSPHFLSPWHLYTSLRCSPLHLSLLPDCSSLKNVMQNLKRVSVSVIRSRAQALQVHLSTTKYHRKRLPRLCTCILALHLQRNPFVLILAAVLCLPSVVTQSHQIFACINPVVTSLNSFTQRAHQQVR